MADSIKKVSDVALTSAAGDAAIKAAEDAANKMKAELDALILMAETSVQEVMTNGATALYDMLALNEPVINFVKTVVSQGLHATDIAGSAILKGMAAVNSFDVHALPMSAAGMALGALQSITDKYIDKLMGPNRIYAEMIVEFIVDPGAAMEALLDELNTILHKERISISSTKQPRKRRKKRKNARKKRVQNLVRESIAAEARRKSVLMSKSIPIWLWLNLKRGCNRLETDFITALSYSRFLIW